MSLRVELRAEAEAEFDQAFDWYDAQRPGLGAAFATAVQSALDRITDHPILYPSVVADIRKAAVRRFPYCVFYRPHADRIEVIAVFQTSRDPSVWHGRV